LPEQKPSATKRTPLRTRGLAPTEFASRSKAARGAVLRRIASASDRGTPGTDEDTGTVPALRGTTGPTKETVE